MKLFNNRTGVSAYEIFALLILIAAAWIGDSVGSHYGEAFGIAGMVIFPLLLIFAIERLAWLEREILLGQKPMPKCICGKENIDLLPEETQAGKKVQHCRCGRSYDISGRGVIEIIENGNNKPFAIWKAFKGWQICRDEKDNND
jgi:hypothetical protein